MTENSIGNADTETDELARLVAALRPLTERVRTDTCWIKEPGHGPRRVDEALSDAVLRLHVGNGPCRGVVPMRPGTSTTRVAVLDLDSHGGETGWPAMVTTAQGIATAARAAGLQPVAFRSSGGRGIHLYFVWDEPQDACSVRTALRAVLASRKLTDGTGGVVTGQVEVFPKQDEVVPGRFGNMFVLPLGGQSVPLLGDALTVGSKADAIGLQWPASGPVPVAEREVRHTPPRPAAGDPGADLERLAGALAVLPNPDLEYEAWLKVILAVHDGSGGSEEGRALARAWSMKSAKHSDEVFDRNVWDWATANGSRDERVPVEHVYRLAASADWLDPWLIASFPDLDAEERAERERARAEAIGRHGALEPPSFVQRLPMLAEMLDQFVLLAEGSRIVHRDAPHVPLALAEARVVYAAALDRVQGPGGRPRLVPRLDRWLKDPRRLTTTRCTFAPGQPELTRDPHEVPALNLWLPRDGRAFNPPAPEDWRERARPFFDHVAYLVPGEAERERFLDWLAHIEQAPGVLPHSHYLLIAHETGIGRNWLAYALARVWAGYVEIGFDLAAALRSGFNGALSRKVLAVVDELREAGTGHDAARVGEKLKSMLTEKTRLINPKYGRQHTEFNCCRFLMFSNHDDALPLGEKDRRVAVIENPSIRRAADYYAGLYKLIDDPAFIGSVVRALQVRDISGFNPGDVAPMSAAKRAVINAGRGEVARALVDVAATWGADCITAADLKREIAEITGSDPSRLTQLAGPARDVGMRAYPYVVKLNGRAQRVWILRNASRWTDALPADVAAEVLRAASPDPTGFEDLA